MDEHEVGFVAGFVRGFFEAVFGLFRRKPKPEPTPVPPPAGKPWHVTLHRNWNFTGREELLTALREALTSGRPAAVTQAIAGLGGVGKTQLALEYVYRYQTDYSAVFWLSAEDSAALAAGYAGLARGLNLPEKDSQDQSVAAAAVHRWLNDNSNWLLVLDNVPRPVGIGQYLPEKCQGHVIITSRHQAWGNVADTLPVPVFPRDKAIEFLLKRSNATRGLVALQRSKDEAAAGRLAGELGDLPLALEQAAAYIEETACTIEHYSQVFQVDRVEMLKWKSKTAEYPDSVASTWQVAFDRLPKLSPAAVELLNLAAFLAPDEIPLDLLLADKDELTSELAKAAGDAVLLDKAKAALRGFSLAEFRADSMSVHRLVQAVTQDHMDKKQRRQWAERAVNIVGAAFPDVAFEYWPSCERLLPHALVACGSIRELGIETAVAARLLNQTAYYLSERARYADSEPLFELAVKIGETALGSDHPGVATYLNNLAELCYDQAKYAEAEPLYKRALATWEKALGPENPRVATALNNLALLYGNQGKYAEAEPLYKRALAIDEKVLGPEHPGVATDLNNLAELHRAQGKYVEAEPLHKRAIAIGEQTLGSEHPDLATWLNNLATLYYCQGKYAEAGPLYKRSLAIREKAFGLGHPAVATALNNLAELCNAQGKYAEAEPLYERALAIDEKARGPGIPPFHAI